MEPSLDNFRVLKFGKSIIFNHMITYSGEEKGLFTFYYEEMQKEEKSIKLTSTNKDNQRKFKKKQLRTDRSDKSSKILRTQPSERVNKSVEYSAKDAFLSKVLFKRKQLPQRELTPIEENNQSVLRENLRNAIEKPTNSKFKTQPGEEEGERELLNDGFKVRYNFYGKNRTEQTEKVHNSSQKAIKLPLIQTTKLTKAYDNLIEEQFMRISKEKHEGRKPMKLMKNLLKYERLKEKKQNETMATIEISCIECNNQEWDERKKLLMRKLGRPF